MKRSVAWSDAARDEYLRIISFNARDNPDAAERVADRIDRAALSLGNMAIGRPGRVTGTYEKRVSSLPYIIAYEIIDDAPDGETIAILHVIHGARNWPDEAWPEG